MTRRHFDATASIGLSLVLYVVGVKLTLAATPSWKTSVADVPPSLAQVDVKQPIQGGLSWSFKDSAAGVRLIGSSADRIVLEFVTGDYTITNVSTEEGTCQEIMIPGYQTAADPGHPSLPASQTAVGVPVASDPSVHVVSSQSRLLPGAYDLCPEASPVIDTNLTGEIPTQIAGWTRVRDATAYAINAFAPADLVELTSTGFIRNQRIAEPLIHPARIMPSLARYDLRPIS